jgi:hypothetical protein|tara:strand:+ start:83 stop:418 length:336 start_codon:yes stop_codon:yes gene_type:complete
MLNTDETFKKDLIQAVRDQRKKNKYTGALEAFKDKYRDRIDEGEDVTLDSGEKFSKGTSTPPKSNGAFKVDEALAWFTSAIREQRVTRKEFNAITKKYNGRKASLSIKGKA